MVALQPFVSEFAIVGRLDDIVVSSKGRIKYLSLSTLETEYLIAVAKSLQNNLAQHLKPGCKLKVTGMQKSRLDREQIEYKAYRIELLAEPASTQTAIARTQNKLKAKVLVCQGSSCSKKGGQAIYQALQTELQSQGMGEKVEIRTTGCMKQCKQAPCLVMPVRNSYSRVKPQQISQLVSNLLK